MKTSDELKKDVQAKLKLKREQLELKKRQEEDYLKSEEYRQKQAELEERKQKLIDEAVSKLMVRIQKGIDEVVSGDENNAHDGIIKFCDYECEYPSSLSDIEDKLMKSGYIFNHDFWEGAEFSPAYSYITINLNQFF